MNQRTRTDWLLLAGFCIFLFFYGLGQFGLLGADEPRYAQIAREMLARRDWITPTLDGQPWLEKPALYYWQAMIVYNIFGVSDWAARVPSAVDATLLVVGVYVFLRRLRPGFHLDGALMTASAAAMVGFAHAASTDMPLAAMFGLAMLAWYAWWETSKKLYLAGFYVFLALATLAKGPVAIVLAAIVLILFAIIAKDPRIIWRALWVPGIALFLLVSLPWYVAVQLRNPEFFRVFILEHNLARFSSDLYHHREPFWFFVPVAILGLVPWIVFVVVAGFEMVRAWWSERDAVVNSGDALSIFLLLWLIVPVLFFSLSQSKLPGYILPALPAGPLLVSEYLRRHAEDDNRPSWLLMICHSIVAVAPVVPAIASAYLIAQHRLPWIAPTSIAVVLAVVLGVGLLLTLRRPSGLRMLRFVTLIPVVIAVAALLKIGSATLDATLSARPVAMQLAQMETRRMPVAVLGSRRETEFGLAFYRDQKISRYELGQIPPEEHLLVTSESSRDVVGKLIGDRRVVYLGGFTAQSLKFYWVAKASN